MPQVICIAPQALWDVNPKVFGVNKLVYNTPLVEFKLVGIVDNMSDLRSVNQVERRADSILEELEHAKKRGAKIYAEIIGAGLTGDAYHVTAPAPEGEGAFRSMREALRDGNVNPEDIDYINAHGTSTLLNDLNETKAIKKLFGEHAYKMAISSTKSMTGHLLGATGAVESIVCILAIKNSIVPPTINLDKPDPECDLNYTPLVAVERNVDYAITNTFGFGGHNSTLLFKKYSA